MKITEVPVEGYEKVVHCEDPATGLRAIISVHDTTLGPALGGIRMWPYPSASVALIDVNRLSRGMTYKSAIADTGLGGGKAVILGDPQTEKSERLLRAMGRFIDSLDGLYRAAEDVGTTLEDMLIVWQETRYVTGLPREVGSSGDPSGFTALGVFLGMQACVERALHTDDFRGVRVASQGCGNVASHLCQHLHEAGAHLLVTDVVPQKARRLAARHGARVVPPEEIYHVDCEVYAPCALGGTLNDVTIPRLKCKIVAGSANNQCWTVAHGDRLRERGILYAPDFVINAGGIINVSLELESQGYNEEQALTKVRCISNVVRDVLDVAEREDMGTNRAAILLAERKLAAGHEHQEGARPDDRPQVGHLTKKHNIHAA